MIKKYSHVLFILLISVLFLFLSLLSEALEVKRSKDGRYVDHRDGTITDTKTGLMWTQKDSYADLGKCLDWNDSKNYVSRLNTGGHSDWRLPTVNELTAIYEESKMLMAYDNNASTPLHLDPTFASGGAYWYWSSETMGSCCARGGSFSFGVFGNYTATSCFISGVRAVRP